MALTMCLPSLKRLLCKGTAFFMAHSALIIHSIFSHLWLFYNLPILLQSFSPDLRMFANYVCKLCLRARLLMRKSIKSWMHKVRVMQLRRLWFSWKLEKGWQKLSVRKLSLERVWVLVLVLGLNLNLDLGPSLGLKLDLELNLKLNLTRAMDWAWT